VFLARPLALRQELNRRAEAFSPVSASPITLFFLERSAHAIGPILHEMGSRGLSEFVVIGAIILVVFGGKHLPRVARALGAAFRNFKASRRDGDRR